jgi:hypothetical protein
MRQVVFGLIRLSRGTRLFRAQDTYLITHRVVLLLMGTVLTILVGSSAYAQQPAPAERLFKFGQGDVQRALDNLRAYSTSQLPALDGFVNGDSNTFDLYHDPHYEFRIRVSEQATRQTLVTVTAKVTAWYPNTDPSKSRYVLLPSNGRLEAELLDHLSALLEKEGLKQPVGLSPNTASPPSPPLSPPLAASQGPNPITARSSTLSATYAAKSATPITPSPDLNRADSAPPAADIAKVQGERNSIEQEEKKLQEQISQLEVDRNARKFLSDLAMVKSQQAPVYEQNNELSKILFRADPEDEFEVTEARFGWVRVRLENQSQGWMKIDELRLPNEKDDTGDSADFGEPNEEVAPFTGNWALLKDKPTLFVVAQPKHEIPTESLGHTQMEFAKHAFLDGYRAAAHSQQKLDGVAVVFLGDKAGMAAATLTDINRWHNGAVSDKLFLERCFLSPPEAFRDIAKH